MSVVCKTEDPTWTPCGFKIPGQNGICRTSMGSKLRVFLILILLGVLSNFSPGSRFERSNRPEGTIKGGIDIRIHPTEGTLIPPAELILIDP